MAISSNISQGSLNRLRGSLAFSSFPNLNVTAPYLGPEGIVWSPSGPLGTQLPTMTGLTNSQSPYLPIRMTVHLIRAQSFMQSWKDQWGANNILGDALATPDSPVEDQMTLRNVMMLEAPSETFSGLGNDFPVILGGYMLINSELWNAV